VCIFIRAYLKLIRSWGVLNFWRANSLDWRYLYSNFDYGLQIVYKLATIEVRTVGGGVMNQSIGRKLTIDGTAPELTTTGLVDGVAWNSSDPLNAVLKDIDPQAKVEYSIKGGTSTFAVLNGAMTTIDGTTKTGNLGLKTLSQIGFLPQTDGSLSKRTEVSLTVTDRAGNVQMQTLKGMVLNLSDLSDDAFFFTSPPSSTVDVIVPSTVPGTPSPIVPLVPGMGGNNQYLYIGLDGKWGSSQAGTGTGAGGMGLRWARSAGWHLPLITQELAQVAQQHQHYHRCPLYRVRFRRSWITFPHWS
jgi:hypothetical protein